MSIREEMDLEVTKSPPIKNTTDVKTIIVHDCKKCGNLQLED